MADVLEVGPLTDAAAAVALGKRHLLVRDYNSAVDTLIQACELLVQKHGDGADELAEPYLLYGRALLNLAREESNVLGSAVPCEKDSDEEAEVEGEDEEEGGGEEEMDVTEDKSVLSKKGDASETSEKKEDDSSGEKKEENKTDEKKGEEWKTGGISDEAPKIEDKKAEEKKPTESKKEEKNGENNATDDTKSVNKETEVSKDEATPGSSKMMNGGSSAHLNGDMKENGEEDEEVPDDEDADNLEVAWEVLELAKLVLLKRGPSGWQLLAEAHKLLGEVAMEGGNASGAVTDFHACLDLLQKIEPCNPRAIAEIYYQLGLAYSFANDFDSSIEQFKEAGSLLEARIKELEDISEPPKSDDPFYTVEGEIKELKELLPEIEEKISDMKDAKQEACRLIIEGIREKASAGSCSNGASTSTSNGSGSSSFGTSSGTSGSSSSTSKPVTDISHLIRKKRKPDEIQAEEASPCKKVSP